MLKPFVAKASPARCESCRYLLTPRSLILRPGSLYMLLNMVCRPSQRLHVCMLLDRAQRRSTLVLRPWYFASSAGSNFQKTCYGLHSTARDFQVTNL